jgi:hypothetical protein
MSKHRKPSLPLPQASAFVPPPPVPSPPMESFEPTLVLKATTQECSTCKYWLKIDSFADLSRRIGFCRRNPPHIINTRPEALTPFGPVTQFPVTEGTTCCGEHAFEE